MSTINILLGFEPIFFDHFLISEEMKRRGQLLFERGKIENVTETRGPGLSRLSEIVLFKSLIKINGNLLRN